jgi:ubiquinone/menaquinone biosynthesis C-methylase UbiE
MDHFEKIYASKAREYHQMIMPEDADGNLLPALQEITPLENAVLLDLGSGTGRIPLLVSKYSKYVIALDLYLPMLLEQEIQRKKVKGPWQLVQGDNRRLPFPDHLAEIVTAGWAIGHLRGWFEDDWQNQIGQILAEMERVAQPEGYLIIIETLTTGALEPSPPTPELAEYYTWLEKVWGFTRQCISTDYQFNSVEEAVKKTEFFFGPELADKIQEENWARLPEWTGIWSKRV